jgi:hypothetical protein
MLLPIYTAMKQGLPTTASSPDTISFPSQHFGPGLAPAISPPLLIESIVPTSASPRVAKTPFANPQASSSVVRASLAPPSFS